MGTLSVNIVHSTVKYLAGGIVLPHAMTSQNGYNGIPSFPFEEWAIF